MFSFIVRRLLLLPVVFVGVTLAIVLLMQLLTPYQRAAAYVQSEQQIRQIPAIIEQFGLEDPWYMQYGRWLGQVFEGNLGYSRTSREPVLTTLQRRFPVTLELALIAIIPVLGVGITMGTAAALNRDRFFDQFTRVVSVIGWSLPTFVLGIWLLVIFYGWLGWFQPGRISTRFAVELAGASGFTSYTRMLTIDSLLNGRLDIFLDALKHMVLPVVTLAVVQSAQIMRVMRSSLLDALGQDYVRTARAKGLPDRVVTRKHARRNALIPVITLSGFVLIGLINGVVITETIFNYPGLGQWAAAAATNLDYASVLGFAIFTAMMVVFANLLVDVLYGIVDPRIRYE
ncbi:MAG: ABC transporter permease [Deinococcales bacterium]|nr:ABC transporter permease [Deinococcales bacterium]